MNKAFVSFFVVVIHILDAWFSSVKLFAPIVEGCESFIYHSAGPPHEGVVIDLQINHPAPASGTYLGLRIRQVAPGAGRVTRLSAPPPVTTPKDVSPPSTANGSVNVNGNDGLVEKGVAPERDVADMTKAELAQERRSLLMKLFADTGTAKIPAVIR